MKGWMPGRPTDVRRARQRDERSSAAVARRTGPQSGGRTRSRLAPAPNCSIRPNPGGSPWTLRSDGSTPMPPCSSADSGHCSSNRCTPEQWRVSPSTPTIGPTPGAGCNAPPTSSPPPRSGRPRRPSVRSASCIASISMSWGSPRRGGVRGQRPPPAAVGPRRRTRQFPGCARSFRRRTAARRRARRVRRELGGHREGAWACSSRRQPSANFATSWMPTAPNSAGTREAREAARYLLVQPPLPITGRAAYGLDRRCLGGVDAGLDPLATPAAVASRSARRRWAARPVMRSPRRCGGRSCLPRSAHHPKFRRIVTVSVSIRRDSYESSEPGQSTAVAT